MGNTLDPVWKALSDPTRRDILDLLRDGPRLTGEVVDHFPSLSRVGVIKHIEVLRSANLVITRAEGRTRVNRLNPTPIRQIYQRWVRGFEDQWSAVLVDLDTAAGEED